MNRQALGSYGESLASAYLRQKGYRIVAQNWRYKKGEIDIIAQLGPCLIFVEVKLRSSVKYGWPEESVHRLKRAKIIQTAEAYLMLNKFEGEIRFDIISILLHKEQPSIRHILDAFWSY
jgi:putative endonuclease